MSFLTELVGSKPTVPTLPSLSLSDEQAKAISSNQANLASSESLVSSANLFSRDQINQMLQAAIPGLSGMESSISGNIESELKGQLPADVKTEVTNAAAAKALSGGTSGSEFGRNIVARDLGLTSLDLTNQGLSSAENWMKTVSSIYEPSMMSVGSMFITPAQQASFDVEERNAQFQQQWMQNQINAMPAPWATDLKQFVYRAMSAYSGTSVDNNPYSTPGSFSGDSFEGGAGMGSAGFGNDYGGEMSGGFSGPVNF